MAQSPTQNQRVYVQKEVVYGAIPNTAGAATLANADAVLISRCSLTPSSATLMRPDKSPGYGNIVPTLGGDDDVKLPEASIDLAIMVDVYHELAFPREVLASIVRALRPGGRVVFVEYRAEDPRVPIKALHKMSEAQVRREAGASGLVWERTAGGLPWQHAVIFRKR